MTKKQSDQKKLIQNRHKRVLITTGDLDGIGLEITKKTLSKISPKKGLKIFVYRGKGKKLHPKSIIFNDLNSALESSEKSNHSNCFIYEVHSIESPALWVEDAAKRALSNEIDTIVTGPISKDLILLSGMKDIGHTDILKRVCKSSSAHMGFIGKKFNVVLATGHCPTETVETKLQSVNMAKFFELCLESRKLLKPSLRNKPLAVLGLNPHSGDNGIIGKYEIETLQPLLRKFSKKEVHGPLIPDVAFSPKNWNKYSFFVALYHDQGLIPFKMIHGFQGVHITLGLPIKRCSVDHGTAKDIFGKNIANPSSMSDAIKFGIKLAKTI